MVYICVPALGQREAAHVFISLTHIPPTHHNCSPFASGSSRLILPPLTHTGTTITGQQRKLQLCLTWMPSCPFATPWLRWIGTCGCAPTAIVLSSRRAASTTMLLRILSLS